MKTKAILFLTVLLISSQVMADLTKFLINNTQSYRFNYSIDSGVVVWNEAIAPVWDYDIKGINLTTGQNLIICSKTETQYDPSISGNNVIWTDNRNGNWDIYGYNLVNATEFPVCTALGDQTEVRISGTTVVFRTMQGGTSNNGIWKYDISTNTKLPICTSTATNMAGAPDTNGNIVIWWDGRNSGGRSNRDDIYGYNLATQTEFPVCTAVDEQTNPKISGNTIVWLDWRDRTVDSFAIYGYNLLTNQEFPIFLPQVGESVGEIDISGNFVIWEGRTSPTASWDIYGYDLMTGIKFPIATTDSIEANPAIGDGFVIWNENNFFTYGAYVENTPEPSTIALLITGLVASGLFFLRRK